MAIRIFRHYWQLHVTLLAIADFVLFSATMFVVLRGGFLRPSVTQPDLRDTQIIAVLFFGVIGCLGLAAMGLYGARHRVDVGGMVVRILMAVAGSVAALLALKDFMFPRLLIGEHDLLIVGGVVSLGAAALHVLMERVVGDSLLKIKVVVYGAGQRANSLLQLRRRSDQRGFVIVGYVPAAGDEPQREMSLRTLDPQVSLREHCRRLAADEIVVAMDDRRHHFPVSDLLDCKLDGIEITELVTFLEREAGKLRLDVLNPSWLIFSDGFRRGRLHIVLERMLDMLASLALLIVALPFIALTVLAIKLEDGLRASVFYRQERVGQYGRTFGLMKFRSMREDAERDGKPKWASKNDSRVTRVGAFIRKTRIDELPQILNVLRGDMSFVGPRPERPQFVQELSELIPYYEERHTIKPGITGWAQLCYPYGSSEKDATEKLQYDLYYIKNRSLLFYLSILVQTVEVIVWGKGAR